MNKGIIGRKIYSRTNLLELFYCPAKVPTYLLAFPELLKDADSMWCKKSLPKFDEVVDVYHNKANYLSNKYKGRQRSISSQSGNICNDDEMNLKYRHQANNSKMKSKIEKCNRYNLFNESQTNTSVNKDILEDNDESTWKTIESKSSKFYNLTKPYVSTYQGQENHWKKFGKDRVINEDKSVSQFNKTDKTNNFIVRKVVPDIKLVTKIHASQSFSAGTDQTEDIWQDDWDTEMQSQIVTNAIEELEYYELPLPSISALTNATSLSSKVMPLINLQMESSDSIINADSTNEINTEFFIEEKRKLEECKVQLKNERQSLLKEQEEWKIRMQEEWKIRMQEEMESKMKSFFEQKTIELNRINSPMILPTKSTKEVIDNLHIYVVKPENKCDLEELKDYNLLSIVDRRNENKMSKNIPERQIYGKVDISLSEVVIVDVNNTSKVLKESNQVTIDEFKQQIHSYDLSQNQTYLWNLKSTVSNIDQPIVSKSLLEIQAEEIGKEKMKQELVKSIHSSKVEANKLITFKESLLKNVKPVKTSVISSEKTICDWAAPVHYAISLEPVEKLIQQKCVKKTMKQGFDNNNKDEDLLNWCNSKLSTFNKDLDVFTVVELLKDVPNENVVELIVELLDDSAFSRNFAKDFIKIREDCKMITSNVEDVWKTVKKSPSGVTHVNKSTSSNRKTKKSVVHRTKFLF